MIDFEQWEGFEGRIWKEEVNVRDFIQKNYTPYDGDESLSSPTPLKPPISSGAHCRSCRRPSAPRAACWIWRPTSSAA